MPRKPRIIADDGLYHVINRRVAQLPLFETDGDYQSFLKALAEVIRLYPVRILAYCLMPNHWHLLLWPTRGSAMPPMMQRLTVTHMRRWHAHRESTGSGPVYQGRYKSFPIQDDDHLLTVARYIERNALRARLVKRAEDWPWTSLHDRVRHNDAPWLIPPAKWPVPMRRDWLACVNRAETAAELESLRLSVNRGRPFGTDNWQKRAALKLKLEQTLRDPWRPKGRRKPSKK
jgi:putative transposase